MILWSMLTAAAMTTGAQPESSHAADRVHWLRQHVVPIPAAEDPSDPGGLKPVLRAIGESRIVLLGEAAHGDGATFRMKSRLIRLLHQRAGFDVVVWESPFYACYVAGTSAAPQPPPLSLERAVLPLWSGSRQCAGLFDYIRATWQTARPLAVVGLSPYVLADGPVFEDVIAFFERVDPGWPTAAQRRALYELRAKVERAAGEARPTIPQTPPQRRHLRDLMELIDTDPDHRLRRVHGRSGSLLMREVLGNLEACAETLYAPLSRGGTDDNPLLAREGRNLVFWATQQFPQRKLIVWAHSGHLVNNAASVEEMESRFGLQHMISAGEHAARALGEEVYSVMFLSHGGASGTWWDTPREIPRPAPDSLETLLHAAGFTAAFLDLRGLPADHWLRQPQVASPIAHRPLRAVWPRCFDGLVYIDEMSPSRPVKSRQ